MTTPRPIAAPLMEKHLMGEIFDFQAGRAARIAGNPRDGRRNADWLRGWDQEEGDAARWKDELFRRTQARKSEVF